MISQEVAAQLARDHIVETFKNEIETEKEWNCADCERKFSTKGNLSAHNKRFHISSVFDAYPCPECGILYGFKRNFRTHFLKEHSAKALDQAEAQIIPVKATYKEGTKVIVRVNRFVPKNAENGENAVNAVQNPWPIAKTPSIFYYFK